MSYISAILEGDTVKVWERVDGVRLTKLYQAPADFYIEDAQGADVAITGQRLRRILFRNQRDLRAERELRKAAGEKLYESDVSPVIKVLSRHYYGVPGTKPHVTLLDIEVDYNPSIGHASEKNPYAPINSVALYHEHQDRAVVIAVPPPEWDGVFDESLRELGEIHLVEDERQLLSMLLDELEDSDIVSGWNAQLFDFPYIARRIEMVLGKISVARLSFPDAPPPKWREQEVFKEIHNQVVPNGRLYVDYMLLYKKFSQGERESYKLEAIADEHLPDLPKLKYDGSLASLYHNHFNYFLRYNLRDTEILKGFERELGFIDLAIVMYREATGLLEHVTGTVRIADYAIYNYCHHVLGVRVPDINNNLDTKISLKGAHVLDPTPGMREWVGSVDVTSLYPSCIRSCNISPETVIGQFVNDIEDYLAIKDRSARPISLKLDGTNEVITKPAIEWRTLLDGNNCAVSGFGTVFSMDTPGIIPNVLKRWFDQRAATNARIAEIDKTIEDIIAQYSTRS